MLTNQAHGLPSPLAGSQVAVGHGEELPLPQDGIEAPELVKVDVLPAVEAAKDPELVVDVESAVGPPAFGKDAPDLWCVPRHRSCVLPTGKESIFEKVSCKGQVRHEAT